MAPMLFDEILKRNELYAENAEPIPHVSDFPAGFKLPRVFIICCFDFRLVPEKILQLNAGEAFVVRNVGGSVRPNIGDIIYTDVSVGFTLEEIIVIHHDDCGTQHLSAQTVKEQLKARLLNAGSEINSFEFPTHYAEDVEQSVREDVRIIREANCIREELRQSVKGYVLNLKSNRLHPALT